MTSKRARVATSERHEATLQSFLRGLPKTVDDGLVYTKVDHKGKACSLRYDLAAVMKALIQALGEPPVLGIDFAARVALQACGGRNTLFRIQHLDQGSEN